jgi:NAD(P)H-hydrate epimerase
VTEPTSPPPTPSPAAAALTREQVRRVDRIATDRYGVPGIVLMENAARGVVDAMWRERISHADVLVLCGGGNNGGDGLAVARHLANGGSAVTVGLCTDPAKYSGDAAINWRIVRAMGLHAVNVTPEWLDDLFLGAGFSSRPFPLIVDAIFGTGLVHPPRDPFPALADALNRGRRTLGATVLSIDLPSGLDADTGLPLGPTAVRADLTVTFVAEKLGFRAAGAAEYTGKVVVAGIGCPAAAVDEARAADDTR